MKLAVLLSCLTVACGDNAPSLEPAPDAAPDAPVEPMPEPGFRMLDYFIAVDVSPDGRLAAFEDFTTDVSTVHVLDTITGETKYSVDVGDPSRNIATGIANTGALSALHGMPTQAGLWTERTDWQDLGSPHAEGCGVDEISGAFDLSGDGAVVVGLAWNGCTPDAFTWKAGVFTSLERLGTPFTDSKNPPSNRATVVSDDGAIAAGFAQQGSLGVDRSPAVWKADGTGVMLAPASDAPGEVLSISGDGITVAGQLGFDGFLWTPGTGLVTLPRPDSFLPTDTMFPNAINGDGSLIFGGIGDAFFGIPVAFVWDAEHGTRSLSDVAIAAGVALPEGTILNSVLGASADGSVLAGTAMNAEGIQTTFLMRLPATAFATP